MRTKLLVLAAAGLMTMGTGAVLLVGCSAGPTSTYHPAASQLKEGVNLLDVKTPSWGMNAAFVQSGRVVYMETRVGALKPDVYRQSWPDDPANEMDMRFVDQSGYTFYVMRGGDTLVDPTWSEEMTKTGAANLQVAQTERDLDWKIAQTGAKALAAALPGEFKDHVFHVSQFAAQPTPAEDPFMQAKEARILATPIPAEQQAAYGSLAYNGSAWLETDKYQGGVCFAWICPAKHSATNMWYYTTGWHLAIVANNHGRSPSQLSYDCYSNGGWYGNAYLNGSTAGSNTGNGDGQGGCQTAYSWNSGGYNHLCNDDAAYELWQAKKGSQWTYMGFENGDAIGFQWQGTGWGGSSNSPYYACDCQSFNGCSGDWNTPHCP